MARRTITPRYKNRMGLEPSRPASRPSVYELRRSLKSGKAIGSLGDVVDENEVAIKEALKEKLIQTLKANVKSNSKKVDTAVAGLSGSNLFVSNTTVDPKLYGETLLFDSATADYLAQAAIIFSKYPRNNPPIPYRVSFWQGMYDTVERTATALTQRQVAIANGASSKRYEPTNMNTVAGQSKYVVNTLYNYKFGGLGWVWLAPLGEALVAALPKIITWVGATLVLDKAVKVFHGDAKAQGEALAPYYSTIEKFAQTMTPEQLAATIPLLNQMYAGQNESKSGGFFSNISTTFKVLGWTALAGGVAYVGYRVYESKKK